MPRVKVNVFAQFRELVGSKEIELDLPEGSRVIDMLKYIETKFPRLKLTGKSDKRTFILMKGGRWPELDDLLKDGDVYALFPPIGGG